MNNNNRKKPVFAILAFTLILAMTLAGCAKSAPAPEESVAPQESQSAVPEESAAAEESAAPEESGAESIETADPYSFEELTKDIPADYWDQFLPEIEEIYEYTGQDWDWDEGWCEYNGEYILTGDQEYIAELNDADHLYESLLVGKSRIYDDLFESELPLNSSIGYYLLGLRHDNDIVQLYSVTQLAKYIGSEYENAAIEGLNEIIRQKEANPNPNQSDRLILQSAEKFKAFLEHDFDYNPDSDEFYAFEDSYIWSPERQPDTPLPVVAWVPQMGTLVDARRIGGKMWVSNGYEIWEIYAYPDYEYTRFNSDGSEFTFLDWGKTVTTYKVDDMWDKTMYSGENILDTKTTAGDYIEPSMYFIKEGYYRPVYRATEKDVSQSSAPDSFADEDHAEWEDDGYDWEDESDFGAPNADISSVATSYSNVLINLCIHAIEWGETQTGHASHISNISLPEFTQETPGAQALNAKILEQYGEYVSELEEGEPTDYWVDISYDVVPEGDNIVVTVYERFSKCTSYYADYEDVYIYNVKTGDYSIEIDEGESW